MYIPIAMCLLFMANVTVDGCVLKRVKGLTAERIEPVTTVGAMGNSVLSTETPTRKPMVVMPELKTLEDVRTTVNLVNVSVSEFCVLFSDCLL